MILMDNAGLRELERGLLEKLQAKEISFREFLMELKNIQLWEDGL